VLLLTLIVTMFDRYHRTGAEADAGARPGATAPWCPCLRPERHPL